MSYRSDRDRDKDRQSVEKCLLYLLLVIIALGFMLIVWHQMFLPNIESEESYVPETSVRPGPADRSGRAP